MTLVSNYLAMDWRNNPKEADHVKVTMNDCTVSAMYILCVCVMKQSQPNYR